MRACTLSTFSPPSTAHSSSSPGTHIVLKNHSDAPVSLNKWRLVAKSGEEGANEEHVFEFDEQTELAAFGNVKLWAEAAAESAEDGDLILEGFVSVPHRL